MKAVIFAGGVSIRLSEETATRPKPMIEIGGYPILWLILKTYSYHGINEFIICCGYKGYVIKDSDIRFFLQQVVFGMLKRTLKTLAMSLMLFLDTQEVA